MTPEKTSPQPKKRKGGAQPGNQNARTHGFYSKALTPEQREALRSAAGLDGLDQEIAILRMKIASILVHDPHNYNVLILALTSLARLLQTKHQLSKYDSPRLSAALQKVLKDIASPLGLTLSKTEDAPPDPVSDLAERLVSESFTSNDSRSM
jgi:hypothetical protein